MRFFYLPVGIYGNGQAGPRRRYMCDGKMFLMFISGFLSGAVVAFILSFIFSLFFEYGRE